MKAYLTKAEDIRGHFCLGRVFLTEEKAEAYCKHIYEEKLDMHVDTPEGGHYFIFGEDVVEIELDEELIRAIQKREAQKGPDDHV